MPSSTARAIAALLVGRRALGHQAADGAGAEAEHGNFEAGAAQFTLLHFSFPFETFPASFSPTRASRGEAWRRCASMRFSHGVYQERAALDSQVTRRRQPPSA